jgi:hypothetical protein
MKFKIEEETRYIIYWHNGVKWLIKEIFDDKVKAEDHIKQMEERERKNK